LDKQRDSLLDAEEEVQKLTEEHKQAFRKEGYEQAPLPAELLTIPEHLAGPERTKYQDELDALEQSRVRHLQEAAAITGRLQTFTKAPKTPIPDSPTAMETDKPEAPQDKDPGNATSNPAAKSMPRQNGAKTKSPEEIEAAQATRAEAQKAADLRLEQVAAASKKQRVGENIDIVVNSEEKAEDL